MKIAPKKMSIFGQRGETRSTVFFGWYGAWEPFINQDTLQLKQRVLLFLQPLQGITDFAAVA